MDYLLDTGILLRMVEKGDPFHAIVTQAVDKLQASGNRTITTAQNVCEYWNVSTRPANVRGGFGISIQETDRRLRFIERSVYVLPEPLNLYAVWRRLIVEYAVSGVKVHDARIVALMIALGHTHILTLNPIDFKRFREITARTPTDILSDII